MQKIILTGSNGFLGQKLLQALLQASSFDIMALSKGEDRYNGAGNYQYLSLDICQSESLCQIIKAFRPQIILHTVALAQVETCESQPKLADAVNFEPVIHLVELCKEFGAKLIFLSTDFVFDGQDGPYAETDPARPLNVYGESKLKAEKYIRDSGISWAIIRTILVYGLPHDPARSNFVLWVKQNLEQQNPLKIVTDHFRMPTLVEDLVEACLQIIQKHRQGLYHISGPELINMYEFAKVIADFWDLDAHLIEPVLSSDQSSKVHRPSYTGFILEKAIEELDYAPRTLKDGLSLMNQQLNQPGSDAYRPS